MSPAYAPGRVLLRQTWAPADTDAAAYIAAVEAADGQALEEKTRKAIDDFVLGCKADGIWSAIKASCILAGARTLTGALVPLVGAAPTNFNFVSGDYNRKTGLVGDGSTKYLNSNRNNNADPQDNFHASAYSLLGTLSTGSYLGVGPVTTELGATNFGYAASTFSRSRNNIAANIASPATALVGVSRASSSGYTLRTGSRSYAISAASQTPYNGDLMVFSTTSGNSKTDARLAFYSIGESLNLTLLDARVTQLITTFAAVIP